MTYLLDADTLNYILKGVTPVKQRFREATATGATFVLSVTVHYQITRYLKLKGSTRLAQFYTSLVTGWPPVELQAHDWDTAADLWAERHRAGKPIQDADLLIAVAALKAGATLVTNNTKHFEDLGLFLENWRTPDGA